MTNIESWIINTQTPEEIKDIVEHGCSSGVCCELIYYDDTVKFYDRFSDEIWDLINETSDSLGHDSVFDFFNSWFNRKQVCSETTFKNALSWFAVEQTCLKILEEEKYAQFMS